jgi:hypothetical protein
MKRPSILPAFSDSEFARAKMLLGHKVAEMGMRKFEEGDWSDVYAAAKGLPSQRWSNLDIDVMHEGLGVEQKMLGRDKSPLADLGTTRMHPAATRSLRVPDPTTEAEVAKTSVLEQYADLIEARRAKVAETSPTETADLRIGWLLWRRDLSEFLYFEEEWLAPDPNDFRAEWKVGTASGSRKASTNLWIFENETGKKRYSVTGQAGVKLQPYFDVPASRDEPGVYYFHPQGDFKGDSKISTWIRDATAVQIQALSGSDSVDDLDDFVHEALSRPDELADRETHGASEVSLRSETYELLREAYPEMTDDERFQALLRKVNAPD